MADYKPKVRKPDSDKVFCIFCYKEIPAGATYHWIKSRAGVRPICCSCAEKEGLLTHYAAKST